MSSLRRFLLVNFLKGRYFLEKQSYNVVAAMVMAASGLVMKMIKVESVVVQVLHVSCQ